MTQKWDNGLKAKWEAGSEGEEEESEEKEEAECQKDCLLRVFKRQWQLFEKLLF